MNKKCVSKWIWLITELFYEDELVCSYIRLILSTWAYWIGPPLYLHKDLNFKMKSSRNKWSYLRLKVRLTVAVHFVQSMYEVMYEWVDEGDGEVEYYPRPRNCASSCTSVDESWRKRGRASTLYPFAVNCATVAFLATAFSFIGETKSEMMSMHLCICSYERIRKM